MLKKAVIRNIALERVEHLISNALTEAKSDQNLVNEQAMIAKRIAMRTRLRLNYDIRQLYCKKCKQFIIPGRDARIRIGRYRIKAIRISCLRCGHIYRRIIHQSKDL
jgi:ribonuclease P protein subunit RPR2